MSAKRRLYFYGYPRAGKAIYAYTKDEWGLGASSGGGDHNLIRSFYFSLVITVLMFLPATLICAIFAIIALFKFPVMSLVFLFFGLVFGLGVVQGYFNITEEWRGRKLRKLKGLPKPWFTAHDDHAYEAFLKHPSPHIPLTLEYFPESRILREETTKDGQLRPEA